MNNKQLIKCAQLIVKKPSVLNQIHVRDAETIKYANAVKAVYNVKLASLDLMDQAAKDPNLAQVLVNQVR